MRVNYNVSAILANKALNQTDSKLSNSSERLSTGYKINHAKDSPSGLAIAHRMTLQLRGLSNAAQIASDGVSVVQTAEGAIQEIQDMVQRMSELSVQAANGTMGANERSMIQDEIDQLNEEIDRISKDTDFNGKKILSGEFDLKGYTNDSKVKVSYYADEVKVGKYNIKVNSPSYDVNGNLVDGTVSVLPPDTTKDDERAFPDDYTIRYEGSKAIIEGRDSFRVDIMIDDSLAAASNVKLDLTGIGAMRMQIGANEGEVLELRIPTIGTKELGTDTMDVTTEEGAKKALDQAKKANSFISSVRSRLGAYQNRLEHTANSIDTTNENLTDAFSRLMDTDMAEEMIEYSNQQVLTQAGISVLSQANERPQQVLQLLQ